MKPTHEEAILKLALEKPLAERADLLDVLCGDDAALRERIEALLAEHDLRSRGCVPELLRACA